MPNRMQNNWIRSLSNVGKPRRAPASEPLRKDSNAPTGFAGFEFRKGSAKYELQKSDPVGLLCMTIQAEASDVARAVAVLESQKIHLTHATVSDFYSLLGENVWIIESCVKCIFDVALKKLKSLSTERKEARNTDFLAALEKLESVTDSQLAFENSSLPPGERFIVIQRARNILSVDLMTCLAEIDREVRKCEQLYREDDVGNIEVGVYNALVEYLGFANNTKRRASDIAFGALTQWMNENELQSFAKKFVGVLSGFRLKSFRGSFIDERIKRRYLLSVSVDPKKGANPVEDNGRIGPEIARQLNAIAAERLKIVLNAGVSDEELARSTVDPHIAISHENENAFTDRARPEKLLLGTWNSQSRPDRQVLCPRTRRESGARLSSSALKRRPPFQSLGRRASFTFKSRSAVDVSVSIPSTGRE